MKITRKILWNIAGTVLVLTVLAPSAIASSKDPGKVIAGWVEKVTLPQVSADSYKAKLDSGAKTSSLHAINIHQFKKEGKRWVSFDVTANNGQTVHLERLRKRSVKIKEMDGTFDRRPVVIMDVCFDGRVNSAEFTLTDRSTLIYPILLGRDFLAGKAVIDPDATFLTQANCGELPPPPPEPAESKRLPKSTSSTPE